MTSLELLGPSASWSEVSFSQCLHHRGKRFPPAKPQVNPECAIHDEDDSLWRYNTRCAFLNSFCIKCTNQGLMLSAQGTSLKRFRCCHFRNERKPLETYFSWPNVPVLLLVCHHCRVSLLQPFQPFSSKRGLQFMSSYQSTRVQRE